MTTKPQSGSKYRGQGTSARDKTLSDTIIKLIAHTSFPCPIDLDMNNEHSLRELCLALLESVNDRMTQLRHQRRANKHILNRLNEFKLRIAHCPDGALILNPSVHLLDGYSELNVDDEHIPICHVYGKDVFEYQDEHMDDKNTSFFWALEDDGDVPRNFSSLPPIQKNYSSCNLDVDSESSCLPGTLDLAIMKPHDIISKSFQVCM